MVNYVEGQPSQVINPRVRKNQKITKHEGYYVGILYIYMYYVLCIKL